MFYLYERILNLLIELWPNVIQILIIFHFFYSIGKWLVPSKPPRPPPLKQRLTELIPRQFSYHYWRNNKQFLTFLYFILLTNIILFVTRAYYFRSFSMLNGTTPNPFYMMSRANGRCLNFNCTIILVLVLRYTITKLRELGLSSVLPLDHNIYLHKVVGYIIFIQA